MPWRCRIGFHQWWESWTPTVLVQDVIQLHRLAYYCGRCGKKWNR